VAAAYRLTRAAADDVVAIYIAGVDMFGPAQAESYSAGLEGAFRFLAEYPRAARLRAEMARPIRAYPYKSHLILYRTDQDGVLIIRIRHAREDWTAEPDWD
jgi:toxin ParE1/3/4